MTQIAPLPATEAPDRTQLQQIIAGVTEGIVLVEPDRRIVWANEAALAMHGAEGVGELGATVDDDAELYRLSYRNGQALGPEEHPCAASGNAELLARRRPSLAVHCRAASRSRPPPGQRTARPADAPTGRPGIPRNPPVR